VIRARLVDGRERRDRARGEAPVAGEPAHPATTSARSSQGAPQRRSDTLARHYVFRDPADLLRKIGASQKNDGPISDDIRFNVTFHQTKWSDEEGGRVYRHDVRALQAFRKTPGEPRPVEAVGEGALPGAADPRLLSDALLRPRSAHEEAPQRRGDARAGYRPHAGALRPQPELVHPRVAHGRQPSREWTVLHARAREDAPAPTSSRARSLRAVGLALLGPARPAAVSRSRSRCRSTSIITLKVRASCPTSSLVRTAMFALP
jgi:hypothetical protein